MVTEDDFIVDDDASEEYETASSTGEEEGDGESPSAEAELEEDWVGWADGGDVDEKLRSVVNGRGALFGTDLPTPFQLEKGVGELLMHLV